MRRHPALEPFSRDHNGGLILARRLSLAAESGMEDRATAASTFLEAWKIELKDHFDEEERLLGPLAPEVDRERLLREHAAITEHVEAMEVGDLTPLRLADLGRELHDHIRWEEREFFMGIERNATTEQLRELALQTGQVEERRWAHDLRRAELVSRRNGQRQDSQGQD